SVYGLVAHAASRNTTAKSVRVRKRLIMLPDTPLLRRLSTRGRRGRCGGLHAAFCGCLLDSELLLETFEFYLDLRHIWISLKSFLKHGDAVDEFSHAPIDVSEMVISFPIVRV